MANYCDRNTCLMWLEGNRCNGLTSTKGHETCRFYKDSSRMTPRQVAVYENSAWLNGYKGPEKAGRREKEAKA